MFYKRADVGPFANDNLSLSPYRWRCDEGRSYYHHGALALIRQYLWRTRNDCGNPDLFYPQRNRQVLA